MTKAFIFDVDGTLIDCVAIHAKTWQDAFRAFGHEIAFDELRGQIGKGGDELMPVFLSKEEFEAKGDAISGPCQNPEGQLPVEDRAVSERARLVPASKR